jgi:hypothetical protein
LPGSPCCPHNVIVENSESVYVVESDATPVVPTLLGRPWQGDGSCRGGYGLAVMRRYGTTCAYCARDLAGSYEAWLDLSVDHVVPRNAIAVGVSVEWIEDLLNHVTCCRACNEFLNGLRITVVPPTDLAAFTELRDFVLSVKRERAIERHRVERTKFQQLHDLVNAGSHTGDGVLAAGE